MPYQFKKIQKNKFLLAHYAGKIKILLILPEARIHKLKIGCIINISFREAPLTATTLAGLIPADIPVETTIVDESVGQKIPFHKLFDIVGISVMTGTANRAYEISEYFKQKQSITVLGGIHVTLMPEEAKKYCDVIVTGFAEKNWPLLINDFINNKLKSHYHQQGSDITAIPTPRRDLQKKTGYMMPNTVLVTRGCKNKCDFCSVPAAEYGFYKRPINDVIKEIKGIKSKRIAISDVHLTNDTDYAKKLFKRMIPLNKKWGALASTNIINDPKLLDLMMKSGCIYLLIGFESANVNTLDNINKGFNKLNQYKEVVKKLHDRNISVQGCFIFGFDEDDKYVFQNTVDLINEIKIDIPRYALYTPYPKTGLYQRLEKEKRILHKNWFYYDTQHVVIRPLKMSPYDLDNGFKWAYIQSFKIKNIFKRLSDCKKNSSMPLTLLGNLAYKLYINRLIHDNNRFPKVIKI